MLRLFTEEGSKKVKWSQADGPGTPITWYKVTIVVFIYSLGTIIVIVAFILGI